jgi:hypothetical protein
VHHWTFWDRVAYLCLWVAAMILAADSALKIAPELAQHVPFWFTNPIVGFAPLALLIVATGCFAVANTGFFAFIGPRHPMRLFLERDSSTDLIGIQTFPNINYIQISVTTSRRVYRCRAWITRVDYDVGNRNFALEFGERFPLPWSKSGSQNDFEFDLEPNHPPIRLNAAIFDNDRLGLDRGTPTNLHSLFQRKGLHRLTIFVSAYRIDGTQINETCFLEILWSGPGTCASVQLKK